MRAGPVKLASGARLMLDGGEWTVEECRPQTGRLMLRGTGGQRRPVTIRALVNDPGFGPVPAPASAGEGERAGPVLEDLTAGERAQLHLRVAHVLEAETGFRSGSPLRALDGEPRPQYDPDATTLGQRRAAKAAELRALGPEQLERILGTGSASERTLRRWAHAYWRFGIAGCADGRAARSGRHPAVTEPVREAIYAVRQETLHRSKLSMATRDRLIRQYVAERHGPDVPVPSYWTLWRTWAEWFGPGGSRQRYARSAAAAPPTGRHIVLHRPGQVVALDTTVLPVKVRETMFGEAVSAHLTMALDGYTHSIVAFRLTLVSDTSVDVAMLIRDIMMPLPMRDGWGRDMEWPYPGVPAAVVAEFAGHKVAGLPFFAPETITSDHGAVYKNRYQVDPVLSGRRVELVFDPFDLTVLQVRSGGKDAGTATPHHITRHSHPKARPEPLPGDDAPRATGIDYLSLLGDQHDRHLAGRVNYAALGPASPGSDGEDAGGGHTCG